jgi:hypothetical protein
MNNEEKADLVLTLARRVWPDTSMRLFFDSSGAMLCPDVLRENRGQLMFIAHPKALDLMIAAFQWYGEDR